MPEKSRRVVVTGFRGIPGASDVGSGWRGGAPLPHLAGKGSERRSSTGIGSRTVKRKCLELFNGKVQHRWFSSRIFRLFGLVGAKEAVSSGLSWGPSEFRTKKSNSKGHKRHEG